MHNLLEQSDSFAGNMDRWLQSQETADTVVPTSSPTTEDEMDDETTTMDILSTVLSNVFLFFLIFGLSATVNMKNLKRQLTNKFAIGCGVAMQFLIMPFLGFLAVVALREHGLTEAMGITLLVVTSSPGGSYSNWWCSTFNADLALSVAMTTVSSILSIGLLPANLFLYTYLVGVTDDNGGSQDNVVQALDFGTLFITLGIVMAAISSGLYAGYIWDNPMFHVYANRFGSVCGILLIICSLFLASGADGAESNFWSQPWAFYVGVAFPCLLGIAVANIIARSVRLSPPETVAISIECCYQNTGIATSVAITMFSDKEERAQAVSVPLFYGIVEAVVIGIYCVWAWKVGWTKAPAEESFCKIISKTYEVDDEETDNGDEEEKPEEDKITPDQFDASEIELDPEALGIATVPDYAHKGVTDKKLKYSEEKKKEPEIIGSGFWARVFPPVLRRMTSSFFSTNADICGEPKDEESQENDDFKTPGKLNQEPRGRFYTAETTATGESSLSSPRNRFYTAETPDEASMGSCASPFPSPSPRSLHVSLREVQETDATDAPVLPSSIPEDAAPMPAIQSDDSVELIQ